MYVLERRRAVEVWKTLMGDHDPEVARQETPNSLRALYGTTAAQNGVMGSPDEHIAEVQIGAIFVSSPPFPTTDLPDDRFGTVTSVSSSVLASLRQQTSDEGYAPSNGTAPSTPNGRLTANGKSGFRARVLPNTHLTPDIVPRMTKAAQLRAGITPEKKDTSPRVPISKERQAQTFANVPGHKRATTIAVASTAAPTIAPRMTKAAALRLGIKPEPVTKQRVQNIDTGKPKETFEGVPGHKRRESFTVASTKAPTVAPRLNKSASLRASKEAAPPTSFMCMFSPSSIGMFELSVINLVRPPSIPKVPGLARTNSIGSLSASTSSRPSTVSRASSQALVSPSPAAKAPSATPRSSSVIGNRPPPTPLSASVNGSRPASTTPSLSGSSVPKLRPRPSSISAPTIAPRLNKSAALRQAKQEAEQQAAAAAAAKKNRRISAAPPSSYKVVAA